MPPELHSVNFSKPVTKYSLMSVMKERVLFMWWALVFVTILFAIYLQARNQDFTWGGANEVKVDQTTEMYFFIV